jgi:hypothetical protein
VDNGSFNALVSSLIGPRPGSTTRRGLTRLLGGLTLGGPLALLGWSQAEAKCKKKCGPCKRCKNGKCRPKPTGTACAGGTCQGGACLPVAPPAPTCAQTCPSTCVACFVRPAASTMCGDASESACDEPCSSDTDCIGSTAPYCVSQLVNRATGTVSNACASGPGAFCTAIADCA